MPVTEMKMWLKKSFRIGETCKESALIIRMAAFWPPLVTVAEKECMDSMPISENKGVLPLFCH